MSIAMPTVSTSAQALIDARLDTIEQSLFGRMPRSERLTIVREVESQIHELLAERGVDDASREDVLAVLARLDPPEAYISDEEFGGHERVVPRKTASIPSVLTATAPRGQVDRLSIAGFIIALCGLGLLLGVVMMYVVIVWGNLQLGEAFGAMLELILIACPFFIAAASLTSLIIAGYTRFRSGWSIAGAISSSTTLLASMIYGLYVISFLLR